MSQYLSELFLKTWKENELIPASSITNKTAFSVELRIIIILVYSCVGISITKYFGHTTDFLDHVLVNPSRFDLWYCSFFFGSDIAQFHSMLYWILMIVVFYLIIPVLIVKLVILLQFRWMYSPYGGKDIFFINSLNFRCPG